MRSLVKTVAVLLCLILVLAMAACDSGGVSEVTTTAPQTTLEPLPAREKYDLACAEADTAQNLLLSFSQSQTRLVGKDTYLRTAAGTASYSGIGRPDMEAVVEEQLVYGSYKSAYKEVYCDGDAFAEVNGSAFTADMTAEEFVARQLPAVLLRQELYATVTAESGADGSTLLTFGGGKAAEAWVSLPEKAKLVSAGGTATLNSLGSLVQSDYRLEYDAGNCRYVLEVSVEVTMPKSLDLGAIHSEHFRNCPKLELLDAPKKLLQVVGDVYTTQAFRCKATESIFSEAIPMTYQQKSSYFLQGAGEDMTANAEYVISLSDYRGQTEKKTRQDSYQKGIYTTVEDGSTKESAISSEAMRQYYEDAILSALLAPTFLENAAFWNGASQFHLEMTGNADFAKALIEEVSKLLQVELEADKVTIQPEGCGGYVAIDRNTGLPAAMGLYLNCIHTVGDISYTFTYSLEQEVTLSDFS